LHLDLKGYLGKIPTGGLIAPMPAIPSTDLEGHASLRDRVNTALDLCQESQGVEFKESGTWDNLKWKVVRNVLAMGNLRDGGVVIIGVAQRGDAWTLDGIGGDDLSTFDPDKMTDQINSFVSPHAAPTIVTHSRGDRRFLVVRVHEFDDTPLVCKKNGPQGEGLQEGAVYVRPPGMARSTRITRAEEMHDLLDLAAEKRARRFLEAAKRIGLEMPATSTRRFEEELGDL
jgi:predicted HTH transcriptional regulator